MRRRDDVVGREIIDLRLDDEKDAPAIQDRVALIHAHTIAPTLERVFGEFHGGTVERLERLTIDLGPVRHGHLEEDFERNFESALRRALEAAGITPRRVRRREGTESPLELIEFLLLHGYSPWWRSDSRSLTELILEAAEDDGSALVARLRRIGVLRSVRVRLVRRVEVVGLRRLVQRLEPTESGFILSWVDDLETRQARTSHLGMTREERRVTVWEIVLGYLLANHASEFDREAFIEFTIRSLALRMNTTYAALLLELHAALTEVSSALATKGLEKILENLRAALATTVRPRLLRGPATSDGSADSNATAEEVFDPDATWKTLADGTSREVRTLVAGTPDSALQQAVAAGTTHTAAHVSALANLLVRILSKWAPDGRSDARGIVWDVVRAALGSSSMLTATLVEEAVEALRETARLGDVATEVLIASVPAPDELAPLLRAFQRISPTSDGTRTVDESTEPPWAASPFHSVRRLRDHLEERGVDIADEIRDLFLALHRSSDPRLGSIRFHELSRLADGMGLFAQARPSDHPPDLVRAIAKSTGLELLHVVREISCHAGLGEKVRSALEALLESLGVAAREHEMTRRPSPGTEPATYGSRIQAPASGAFDSMRNAALTSPRRDGAQNTQGTETSGPREDVDAPRADDSLDATLLDLMTEGEANERVGSSQTALGATLEKLGVELVSMLGHLVAADIRRASVAKAASAALETGEPLGVGRRFLGHLIQALADAIGVTTGRVLQALAARLSPHLRPLLDVVENDLVTSNPPLPLRAELTVFAARGRPLAGTSHPEWLRSLLRRVVERDPKELLASSWTAEGRAALLRLSRAEVDDLIRAVLPQAAADIRRDAIQLARLLRAADVTSLSPSRLRVVLRRALVDSVFRMGGGRYDRQDFVRQLMKLVAVEARASEESIAAGLAGALDEESGTMMSPPLRLAVERFARDSRRATTDVTPRSDEASDGDRPAIEIDNAGLVLLWPLLRQFFEVCGFMESGKFVEAEAARSRAAHLLTFAACGRILADGAQQALGKILCGIPTEAALLPMDSPTDREVAFAETLVTRRFADVRGVTTVDGIRGSYLLRRGHLVLGDHGWHLVVERATWDVLIEDLIDTAQPMRAINRWMRHELTVDW